MTNADPPPIYSDGEAYEMSMGKWSRASSPQFIDWLATEFRLRWLDVGCGTGALCEVIQNSCEPREYVGVDAAEAQLAFARSKHSNAKARFQTDDALALSFHDDEFDAAVSAHVINFVPEPQKMVAEMKRVVAPSGIVATWTWDIAGNKMVSQHIIAAVSARRPTQLKRTDAQQQVDTTRPEVMNQIFLDVGLEDVRTTSFDTVVTYQDFDDYWNSNTAIKYPILHSINEMTDEDRERFMTEVKALVPIASDGTIQYTVSTVGAKGIVPAK